LARRDIARIIAEYEAALPEGGGPNWWVFGNHDRPRIASRMGPPQARLTHPVTPDTGLHQESGRKQDRVAPLS